MKKTSIEKENISLFFLNLIPNFVIIMKQQLTAPRTLDWLIHAIGWGLMFAFPLLFVDRHVSGGFDWVEYMKHCSMPLSCLIVFYLNYFLLIPKYLFKEQRKTYILFNLVIILAVVIGFHFHEIINMPSLHEKGMNGNHPRPPMIIFLISNAFILVLTAGLSAAIRLSERWAEIEATRHEAEQSKTEVELKNLKNQLNPHFLLNTLNNIYALIAFNTDKAQQAVQDLSKLLRYVLYDNNRNYVPLRQDVEFIRNYIDLMRIRLPREVEVTTDIKISFTSETMIAPLLFISLIENAFKHGVNYSAPSFIHICLQEDNGRKVTCHIENSYFPKDEQDKSGSGIGLEQLQRRLDILYPGQYVWQREVKDNKYISILTINSDQITKE